MLVIVVRTISITVQIDHKW